MNLGLFGRKKGEGDADASAPGGGMAGNGNGNGAAPSGGPQPSPDKAARFFERAKVAQETANYEYAMTMWLGGLRQDPTSMRGLESFFQSCYSFLNDEGKLSKETRKMFDGREEIEKYLSSLMAWGMEPIDALLAVKASEHASKLAAEVRNLAAQATMAKGGYDQTGEAGGFRKNIRDLDKQRRLDEGERIVKTEETLDRLVADAAEDYQKRPEDPAAINVYAKRLQERARPEDEKRAREVLKKAFEATKQFRFREMEGTLRLRMAARKLNKYKEDAEGPKATPKDKDNYRQARAQFAQMEVDEYKLRTEHYPTDLPLKFELGKRLFEHGDTEGAIALFQQSQEDAKHRVESLNFLGQSFQRIGWTDEAVQTFRQALESHRSHTDETGMELRYGLLASLQTQAETSRDLAVAEEADKLASTIAIQQISYKDVRARRDAIKKLIAELKKGD